MKKRKIKTWPIIILLVLVCFVVLLFCLRDIYRSLKSKSAAAVEVLETIENYGYSLNENDSEYVETLFKDLKKELSKEQVDEETYASLLSQVFVADFYSLKQAVNKNDIGGTQFVYEAYQEDFQKLAKTSIYAYVENNIYGTRKQELPMVTAVEVMKVQTTEYDTDTATDEKAYEVELFVTYETDLGYPTHVTLILIHQNNKLQIAKMR